MAIKNSNHWERAFKITDIIAISLVAFGIVTFFISALI